MGVEDLVGQSKLDLSPFTPVMTITVPTTMDPEEFFSEVSADIDTPAKIYVPLMSADGCTVQIYAANGLRGAEQKRFVNLARSLRFNYQVESRILQSGTASQVVNAKLWLQLKTDIYGLQTPARPSPRPTSQGWTPPVMPQPSNGATASGDSDHSSPPKIPPTSDQVTQPIQYSGDIMPMDHNNAIMFMRGVADRIGSLEHKLGSDSFNPPKDTKGYVQRAQSMGIQVENLATLLVFPINPSEKLTEIWESTNAREAQKLTEYQEKITGIESVIAHTQDGIRSGRLNGGKFVESMLGSQEKDIESTREKMKPLQEKLDSYLTQAKEFLTEVATSVGDDFKVYQSAVDNARKAVGKFFPVYMRATIESNPTLEVYLPIHKGSAIHDVELAVNKKSLAEVVSQTKATREDGEEETLKYVKLNFTGKRGPDYLHQAAVGIVASLLEGYRGSGLESTLGVPLQIINLTEYPIDSSAVVESRAPYTFEEVAQRRQKILLQLSQMGATGLKTAKRAGDFFDSVAENYTGRQVFSNDLQVLRERGLLDNRRNGGPATTTWYLTRSGVTAAKKQRV